jgi:hypothetical protein
MIADTTDIYQFTCEPRETDRLIRDLGLKEEPDLGTSVIGGPGGGFSPTAAGWADPSRFRSYAKLGKTDFLELFTDGTGTRVRIIYGTI